jgi:hypothetical protein
MLNAGGPVCGLIAFPEHKAALHTAQAKLKMAKEGKPIIKNYGGGRYKRFSERDGGISK